VFLNDCNLLENPPQNGYIIDTVGSGIQGIKKTVEKGIALDGPPGYWAFYAQKVPTAACDAFYKTGEGGMNKKGLSKEKAGQMKSVTRLNHL